MHYFFVRGGTNFQVLELLEPCLGGEKITQDFDALPYEYNSTLSDFVNVKANPVLFNIL